MEGGDEGLLGEVAAGEDEIVLLGGERLPEDHAFDAGALPRARGEIRHVLDMAELVATPHRRRCRLGASHRRLRRRRRRRRRGRERERDGDGDGDGEGERWWGDLAVVYI